MKKIIFVLTFLSLTIFGFSQSSKTVSTDMGLKVLEIMSDGTSEFKFSLEEFKSITTTATQRICITIASRKKNCKSGIGFTCGVFDCPIKPKVNTLRERVQEAEIIFVSDGVIVKFVNPIDWDYLSNN